MSLPHSHQDMNNHVIAAGLLARFGARLTAATRAAGLDAKALGAALDGGASSRTATRRAQRYLAGKSMPPNARVWVTLAAAVGVDPADLLA